MSSQAGEVCDVECEQMRDLVYMADSNQASIVDLLADHAQRPHEGFPGRVYIGRLR
jgi:hypothetical protein